MNKKKLRWSMKKTKEERNAGRKEKYYATKKLKVKQIKKNQPETDDLKTYKIPSTILNKYQLEVYSPENHYLEYVRSRCHQQTYEDFSSAEMPSNLANFATAFKHATEDRNYKVLYELLSKALEIKNVFLLQQIYEYLYIAILHDEKIIDREEMLSQFLARIRLLGDCEPKKYQEREHTFTYDDYKDSEDDEKAVEKKDITKDVDSSDSSDEE